jgi:hypothetical protein
MSKTFTRKIATTVALLSAFTICASSCGDLLGGTGGAHTHSFNKKVEKEEYSQ